MFRPKSTLEQWRIFQAVVQQCRQQQEPTEASQAFTPNRRRNPRRLRRGGCQIKLKADTFWFLQRNESR